MVYSKKEPALTFTRSFNGGEYARLNGVTSVDYHSQGYIAGLRATYPVLTLKLDFLQIERQFDQYIRRSSHEKCKEAAPAEELAAYELEQQCWEESRPKGHVSYQNQHEERTAELGYRRKHKELIRAHYEQSLPEGANLDDAVTQHARHVGHYRIRLHEQEQLERKSYSAADRKERGAWFQSVRNLFSSGSLGMDMFLSHVKKAHAAFDGATDAANPSAGEQVWYKIDSEHNQEAMHIRIDNPDSVVAFLSELKNMDMEPLFTKAELISIEKEITNAKGQYERDCETAAKGPGAERS